MTNFIFASIFAVALAYVATAFVLPSGEVFDLPYDGCGKKVGCFGLPPGDTNCVDSMTCDALLTYSKGSDASTVKFTIYSQNASDTSDGKDHYVAVGINNNSSMNGATIMNCFNKNAGGITFSYSFAQNGVDNHTSPLVIQLPEVVAAAGALNDNLLQCQFLIKSAVSSNGQNYDLTKPTYLLLAGGHANANNTVQYHAEYKDVLEDPVIPTQFPK